MSTKVTNKQIAEVFIKAKEQLCSEGGYTYKTNYICFAISYSMFGTTAARAAARKVIAKRLGRCNTVTAWLCVNKHITENDFKGKSQQIQQYRHRWLDSLIEEFSK